MRETQSRASKYVFLLHTPHSSSYHDHENENKSSSQFFSIKVVKNMRERESVTFFIIIIIILVLCKFFSSRAFALYKSKTETKEFRNEIENLFAGI
jgi:cell division protein FtsL